MVWEKAKKSPEVDADASMSLEEITELRLGLPGENRGKSGTKRGFSETVKPNLGASDVVHDDAKNSSGGGARMKDEVPGTAKPPAAKTQAVGWPPVKAYRKSVMKSGKYVKVAVDGVPYLRKVDLEAYDSYGQLLTALERLFSCFSICDYASERKIIDPANGVEYLPTYEDKDGDWMLVGDVPWKMFVESCKRLRFMKSSEATGSGPRTQSACTSSS